MSTLVKQEQCSKPKIFNHLEYYRLETVEEEQQQQEEEEEKWHQCERCNHTWPMEEGDKEEKYCESCLVGQCSKCCKDICEEDICEEQYGGVQLCGDCDPRSSHPIPLFPGRDLEGQGIDCGKCNNKTFWLCYCLECYREGAFTCIECSLKHCVEKELKHLEAQKLAKQIRDKERPNSPQYDPCSPQYNPISPQYTPGGDTPYLEPYMEDKKRGREEIVAEMKEEYFAAKFKSHKAGQAVDDDALIGTLCSLAEDKEETLNLELIQTQWEMQLKSYIQEFQVNQQHCFDTECKPSFF